ncbi:MAG: hypothetical protein IKV55_05540 [Oscillospiraceae bacterium]|nr:hypothetical protein [Oscillospiraceae bacterium]
MFRSLISRVKQLLCTETARRVLAAVLCLALLGCTAGAALSLSFSVSAMRAEQQKAQSGGDDVLNYMPLAEFVRLSYSEPDLLLQLDASPSPEEIVIYVQDEAAQNVVGIPFEIIVTTEDGASGSYYDDDCNGEIICPGPDPGVYLISLVPVEGYATPEDIEVTVEEKIEHVKVDVSDKILSEDEVDVETEDGKANDKPVAPPPSSSKDTVTWLESEKVLVSSSEVEKPVTDAAGNPLYIAIPVVQDGYLVFADGSVSPLKATLNADGTLAKAEKWVQTGTAAVGGDEDPATTDPAPDTPTDPSVTPDTPAPPTGEWVNCTAEVIDSCGKPIAGADGNPVYKFSSVTAKTEKVTEEVYSYRGWQTIDGKTYYYDQSGKPVTGAHIIQGKNYFFNESGARMSAMGIDVSTWNANIDWKAVKNAGVEFVIIRCGFRGYTAGGLVEDSKFRTNIAGASAAGLKIGVYFFTQAINEREAVEEASMCLQLVSGYKLAYPIFMDMEDAGSSVARANKLSNSQRTAIITAFCDTVRAAGYRAGLYANKYYLTSKINTSQLSSNYVIWLAHYTAVTDYKGRYEMWQYSESGSVAGIKGNVDLNVSYLSY